MNRRSFLLSTSALGAAALFGQTGLAVAQDAPQVPDMTIGSADAPVKVTEYASFTCPHCAHFHATVWPQLKKNYIDTGKVQFTLREVYFDRFGLWAGMVARCGGEMRYFGIADILFDTQDEWLAGGDPQKAGDNLRGIGRKAGMSNDEVNACLNDQAMAEAMVAKYQKDTKEQEVPGTPTFYIDGKQYSNMEYDAFAKILDEELKKKS